MSEEAKDVTIRVLNATFEEVVQRLGDADMTDLHVHGAQDGSLVCVTGEGDVLSRIEAIGLTGEVLRHD